jgi:hypothetical protein
MERVGLETVGIATLPNDRRGEIEARVLRSKLVNLTLDWELTALTIDTQRYKTQEQIERESLRDTANTYRKCVAELSEILANSTIRENRA